MDIRLKKQEDFNLVFNKGKKIYSKSLTIIYINSKTLKIGISLSKKHGNAVTRNRIKRLLRAAYKNYINLINNTYYIVFFPKISDNYDYGVFLKDMEFVLKKGNLIND